jgi:hypothetical protein
MVSQPSQPVPVPQKDDRLARYARDLVHQLAHQNPLSSSEIGSRRWPSEWFVIAGLAVAGGAADGTAAQRDCLRSNR